MRATPQGNRGGFTLVEILLALALLGIILSVVWSYLSSSRQFSVRLGANNQAIEGIGEIQQLISTRVREAAFIFPAGTVIQTPPNLKTVRPDGGSSGKWTIGEANVPSLALVVPPRRSGSPCAAATPDGCATFYLYYAMKRSDWMTATQPATAGGPADPDQPAADPAAGDLWVLVEYTKPYLPTSATGWTPANDPRLQFVSATPASTCDAACAAALTVKLPATATDFTQPLSATSDGAAGRSRLLLDYLSPQSDTARPGAPARLFNLLTSQQPLPRSPSGWPGGTYTYTYAPAGAAPVPMTVTPSYVTGVELGIVVQRPPAPTMPGEAGGKYVTVSSALNIGRPVGGSSGL